MKKLLTFVLSFVSAPCLVACGKEAASIGIIGGADGPTAVFITSDPNWLHIYGLIGLIALIILVAFIIYRKKKSRPPA